MNTPQESFAALIEARMQELKINQIELERRSQITDTTWAGWRAGKRPGIRALWPTIATVLQVPFDDLKGLLDREREKNKPDCWQRKARAVVNNLQDTKEWVDKHGAESAKPVDA